MPSPYDALLEDEPVASPYDALLEDDEPQAASTAPATPEGKPLGSLERARQLGSSPYSDDMGLVNEPAAEALRGQEPLVKLPRYEQQEGVLNQVAAGAINAGAGIVEGLTSPTNLQVLPAAAAPGLGRIVSGLFGLDMLRHVPEQVRAAEDAPTLQGKLEGGLGVVASMLFAGAAGKHAVGKSLKAQLEPIIGERTGPIEPELATAALEVPPEAPVRPVVEPEAVQPVPVAEPVLQAAPETLPRPAEIPADAGVVDAGAAIQPPLNEISNIANSRRSGRPDNSSVSENGAAEITSRDSAVASTANEASQAAVSMEPTAFVKLFAERANQSPEQFLRESGIGGAEIDKLYQHKIAVKEAAKSSAPLNAEAVEQYQVTLPEGYVREGHLYVYKPNAETNPRPAATAAETGIETTLPTGSERNGAAPTTVEPGTVEGSVRAGVDEAAQGAAEPVIPDETTTQIQTTPEGGVETARQEAAPTRPREAIRLIPENKASQWVVDNAKRLFTAEGDLPKETFQRWGERHGEVKEQSRQTAYATRDLQEGLRSEFKIGRGEEFTKGFAKVPKEFVSKMNDALLGEADINTLPETVREPLHRMREHIDTMSKTMLREGIIPEELRAKVEDNLGVYMTRSYRVFDDVKWPQKVAPEVRNKASDFVLKEMQRSNPLATPEQARAHIESMLTDWSQQGTGALLKTGGKIGSKDLTSLIARKDIPVVIRQLMGEYKDPVINYTRSVSKMANLIGNTRFLNEVRGQGLGKWLFEDGRQPTSHSALIAAEASDVMAPLNGLRTTPEIAEAFRTFGKSEPVTNFWAKTYFRINGLAKAGKTVGSVMTQVRNTVGQGYFWMMNGHFDVRPAGGAVKSIAADIGLTNDVKWRESYQRYLKLNVVDQSAKAGELRDVIKDAALGDVNVPGLDEGRTGSSIKKLLIGGPIKAYQIADDLGKIVGFENELARQKAINPTAEIGALEKIAAERIQNTYPTYSRVPEWVKQFRRQPVLGPFMTFAYESFRTAFHNLRYTAEDLSSANPAQKKAGLQRLAGQTAVLAGGYVVGATSRALLGLTVEDEDDVRRFLPRWDKNAQLMMTGADKGKLEYVNMSFSNPYSYLTDPVMAVATGLRNDGELSTLIAQSFGELVRPFVSEDILAHSLIDVARNKTDSGGTVYNPQDTPENILADKLKHVAQAIEPGTSTRLRKKIVPALQGETTAQGLALNPAVEIGSELTGFKRQTLDYEQALSFKARGFKKDDLNAEGIFRETALRKGSVAPEEISEAYARSNSQRFQLWKSLYGDAKAAERRGINRGAIKEALLGNGLSKRDTTAILEGRYIPYEPKDAVTDKLKRLKRSLPPEVSREISRSKTLMLSGEYQ